MDSSEKLYHIIQICHMESIKKYAHFCSKCIAGRVFSIYSISSRITPANSFANTPATATALTREGNEEGGGGGGGRVYARKKKRGGAARGRKGRGRQEEPYILGGAPQLCLIPYPFT